MRVVVFGQAIIHERIDWTEEIRGLVSGADAVICNFEGCLPPRDAWPMKARTVHPAHPEALEMLRDLGVTHLGIANNHAWDFGHAGLVETRRRTTEAGFAVAGAGVDAAEAWAPAVSNGVALIAVDAGPTPDWAVAGSHPGVAGLRVTRRLRLPSHDIRRLEEIERDTQGAERRRRRLEAGFDRPAQQAGPLGLDIEEGEARGEAFRVSEEDLACLCDRIEIAKASADLAVVGLHYHHWSPDWVSAPRWLDDIAPMLIAAGCDAVAGTGPPVAIDAPSIGGPLYAPSLGNLAFHTARGAVYDRLGLPVWIGLSASWADGAWSTRRFQAMRPTGPAP